MGRKDDDDDTEAEGKGSCVGVVCLQRRGVGYMGGATLPHRPV